MRGGWRREQVSSSASAFVPLGFAPGEAYQFDWSHEPALMTFSPLSATMQALPWGIFQWVIFRCYSPPW
jgi:hypothetical protein